MFPSKTKILNFKLKKIRKSIILFTCLIWVFLLFILPIFWKNGFISFEENFLIDSLICSIYFLAFIFFFIFLFNSFSNIKLRKSFIVDSLETMHSAELPIKTPKVVYVYTTHDDFLPSRLLQNMKQTYKNFEVWISDGSTKPEIRKEVVDFAKKHNVRLYQMPESGSKNKADNLNNFLKLSGAKFDYLMIGDSDEVFQSNFVDTSIRFFYSKKFNKLAYVSSMNQIYKTKSLFSNILGVCESLWMFYTDVRKAYSPNDAPVLYSFSSLISGEFLKTMNNQFPSGCLEDFYTEAFAIKTGWSGAMNCLSISMQAYDNTIKNNQSRMLRILDWIVKYQKEEKTKNIDKKYSAWYRRNSVRLFVPLFVIIGFVFFLLLVCVIIDNFSFFQENSKLQIALLVFLIMTTAPLIFDFITQKVKIIGWYRLLPLVLLFPFWAIGFTPKIFYHSIKSIIFSKYSDFGGSPKRNNKRSFLKNFIVIKNDTLFFLLYVTILIIFNVLFWYYNLINVQFKIFVLFNVFFGFIFLSYFSVIFLYLLSFIISNPKYDLEEFIFLKNDYVSNEKTIKNFYLKNPKLKRIL